MRQDMRPNVQRDVRRDGGITRLVGLSIMVLSLAQGAAAQPVFKSPQTFSSTGASTDATSLIAVADVGSFDGPTDGIPDLITAAQNQRAVVLYGRTNGTFVSGRPTVNLGSIPMALTVADMNADGLGDLLIADTTDAVTVLRGDNSSLSQPPFIAEGAPIAVGRNPVAIKVADIDLDGHMDAVVVNEGDQSQGSLTVLLGNSDGSLVVPAAPVEFEMFAGIASADVALADFNGDGRLDAAVANAGSNDVSIFLGDATTLLSLAAMIDLDIVEGSGQEPVAIAAGDVNEDGAVDVIVTNRNSDEVAVLDGQGDGTFATPRFFPSGSIGSSPTGLTLADMNTDGHLDVVVPNNRSSDVSVLLGDGAGIFAAPRAFVADQEPLGATVALVNDDTIPDVITINRGNGGPNFAILLGDGSGALGGIEDVVTAPSPNGVAVGDLNNDGLSDIAVGHNDGHLRLYHARTTGGFNAPHVLAADGSASVTKLGDFNGDDRLDLLVLDADAQSVALRLAQANGTFAAPQYYAVGTGATSLALGDWNIDGRLDFAVARQGHELTGIVELRVAAAGGGFVAQGTVPVNLTPVAIAPGDFNNDSVPDLAVANNVSNDVSILLGNGDGTFATSTLTIGTGGPKALAVADFDRDGFDDIAVALGMGRFIIVYYGDGTGNVTQGQDILSAEGSPSALIARDINGDGVPDIVITDEVANSVLAFMTIPGTRFFQRTLHDSFTVSRRPISGAAGDFDGDGRYDVATANSFVAGSASVLTNITMPAVVRGDGNGDLTVSAADMVALLHEVHDQDGSRVEDSPRGGYAAERGVDANGDGAVTSQDRAAVAARLFSAL